MENISVMVNGLPGKMASKVVEHIQQDKNFSLIPYSLTGPEIEEYLFNPGIIELVKPINKNSKIEGIINCYPPSISVDYASSKNNPNTPNENVDFYCKNKLPFVMGTTGGDRKALEERVKNSEISAVIAPNMAKQIVAFQAMMQYASENFPDAFGDYSLEIKESHQKGKADTSGTAKAMLGYFNKLGIPFTKEQIVMVREPEEQLKIGVPENALTGHGWHTYNLKSKDGNVFFQFTHNVNGRDTYATGTLDAIKYLDKKVKEGSKGQVYDMMDVLRGN